MRAPAPTVHIHYLRPPGDERVHVQHLLVDRDDVKVTLARNVSFEEPIRVRGSSVLEPGADAVWFTFPGRWHDIGRFHLSDGTFTGLYANVLTPPTFEEGGTVWKTTDLFLDLWVDAAGGIALLDEDELARAVDDGRVEPDLARRARQEARSLQDAYRDGRWPPPVVDEWTRERALARLDASEETS